MYGWMGALRPNGRNRTVAVNGTIRSLRSCSNLGAVAVHEVGVDGRNGSLVEAEPSPASKGPDADEPFAANRRLVELADVDPAVERSVERKMLF